MNARAVVCLSLGLWVLPLAAQQTLVASRANDAALPAMFPTAMVAAPAVNAAIAADFDISTNAVGLPGNAPLYRATLPQLPATVCTQAMPASWLYQPSDYAFGRLQFNSRRHQGNL